MNNKTTILLLIGSLFALDIEDKRLIFNYNSEDNNFMADDSTVIDISVPEFISNNKGLMNIIFEIKDAKIEDGGAGAFYIYLKKKRN